MARLAIIIAEDETGLKACAVEKNATLIAGTCQQFSALTNFAIDGFAALDNMIGTERSGWIAIAIRN